VPIANPELDLPLAGTQAGRLMTWIMAALIGTAVLALAVAAGADATLRREALAPRLVTAALPAPGPDAAAAEAETRRALELLRAAPGVAHATPVAAEELDKLVEPWLGPRGEGQPALPMPRLIDVGFNPGATPDLEALAARLSEIAPGARVEDAAAGPPLDRHPARALRLVAGLAGLAAVAAILVVAAAVTRMSLGLHAEAVDLLRLMGARDGYVARQFEQHALANALRGAVAGFSAGLALVVLFILAGALLPGLGLPGLDLRAFDWVLLACVPVAGSLLTALAARLAAAWELSRLR
jgi:cell division transport system permease protein